MTTMSIEQRQSIREELNEAIWKVIKNKYKKDAKEAHEMVSAFGYDIYKSDGHYTVRNENTHKSIYIYWDSYRKYSIQLGGQWKDQLKDKPCKVDFVGCLEKPINKEYRTTNYYPHQSPAVDKYDRIQRMKRDVEWENGQIAEIKKKIESLQDSLIYHARKQKDCENTLRQYKQELHLA